MYLLIGFITGAFIGLFALWLQHKADKQHFREEFKKEHNLSDQDIEDIKHNWKGKK